MISTMWRNKKRNPDQKGGSRKSREPLAFCLGLLLAAALIQLAGQVKGDGLVFPGIEVICRAFLRLLFSGHTWMIAANSLGRLLVSMAIATALGVTLGLAEGMSDFIRALLRPLMHLLRSIPMIVLVVIIMVLMPYQRVPVTASSLILLPIISEAVSEGCRRIEPELIDVYRLNSGFGPRIVLHIYLPLMGGYLRQAWVNAAGMGLRLVISTEYLVQTRNSLGKAIYSSSYFNEYQDIYAYALIMILLVLLIGELPGWMLRLYERRKTGKSAGD